MAKMKRGFAAMSIEQRRAIASKGGRSVPAERRTFSADAALASRAGRKGGSAVRSENRSFARDRDLAARAGRKGGKASKTPAAVAAAG